MEPLTCVQARKLLSKILNDTTGEVIFARHALAEMKADRLTIAAVHTVLRTGRIWEPAELVNGSWRYRVHGVECSVVVTFSGNRVTIVVTAWRR